ncbi:hypothetical protein KAR91_20630 [Candidatus Pacearchaeota archaeon]|nr:hypothetical protein [Candidatus Pacearchaeota archaeon]
MITFPTLTAKPIATNWSETPTEDSVIRTSSESGQVIRRAKFTSRLKRWSVHYSLMSQTDKNLLTTFENTINYGADSFVWTNPQDSLVYNVNLQAPIKYDIIHHTDKWSVELSIEESYPNSSNSLQIETIIATNQNLSTSDITMVGRILHTGDQADSSDLSLYFQFGSDVDVDYTSVNSDVFVVSDINQGAVNRVFSLRSDVLHSGKNFYYRAIASAKDGSTLGYGEIKSISSDLLGY